MWTEPVEEELNIWERGTSDVSRKTEEQWRTILEEAKVHQGL